MRAKIINPFDSSFFIYLLVLFSCNSSESIQKNKINISETQDTNQTYTLGNCTFNNKKIFEFEDKVAKNLSMGDMCHECLLYNDTVISIWNQRSHKFFGLTHTIEINSQDIVVKINIAPKRVILYESPYSSNKNGVLFHTDGVVIANRTHFMKKLSETGILNITPKDRGCIGADCLVVKIKKANDVKTFNNVMITDTVFENACKAVQMLVEQEIEEAGIFLQK